MEGNDKNGVPKGPTPETEMKLKSKLARGGEMNPRYEFYQAAYEKLRVEIDQASERMQKLIGTEASLHELYRANGEHTALIRALEILVMTMAEAERAEVRG